MSPSHFNSYRRALDFWGITACPWPFRTFGFEWGFLLDDFGFIFFNDTIFCRCRMSRCTLYLLRTQLAIQLVQGHLGVVVANNGLGWLPDLQDVVFSSTGNQPGIVRVPAEVSEVVRVAAVHEETILRARVSKRLGVVWVT